MKPPPYEPILVAEEISRIIEGDAPIRERLQRVAQHLKRATHVDVCTIYRRSEKTGDLYLESTEGLAAAKIGELALRKGQGLTGLVVSRKTPLSVRDGPSHPNFRYVPGIKEETFHSFLGTPIFDAKKVIGALVVQTVKPRDFGREDIALLTTISRHIGSIAGKIFQQIDEQRVEEGKDTLVEGVAVLTGRSLAPGFYVGRPFMFEGGINLETIFTPGSKGAAEETKALRHAARQVIRDLEEEARAISGSEGHAVLMAHKVILEDPELVKETEGRIAGGVSAAEAVRQTGLRWIRLLAAQPDRAFAARAADFKDIADRLLRALGIKPVLPSAGKDKPVAVASTILPGELLRLGPARLGAMVITDQGIYSHTSILARSFGIPSVQMDKNHLGAMLRAQRLLVDGTEGIVICDPTPETAAQHEARSERITTLPETGREGQRDPVLTADGHPIRIGVNAGMPEEFHDIATYGPDDIGLYRTEIAFMSEETLPAYDAQLGHYRRVLELAGGRKVSFRTFDFGGDKLSSAIPIEPEANPMMGYRSTRFMLGNEGMFRTQLGALLAASASGPMSLLLPMISTPEELNLVLDEINTVKNEMDQDGIPFDREIAIGVMLEVPSVLFMIDELSRLADYFCVGANDLVQYLMAADRGNPRVARLYQWNHPGVLAALDHLLRECRRNERPVTMCGEMANHPWAALVLAGMGFDHLSIDSHSIPLIKWTLRSVPLSKMQELAQAAMRATSSNEVIELFYGELAEMRREGSAISGMMGDSLNRLRGHAMW